VFNRLQPATSNPVNKGFAMSELLRGPHHCVGIATSVTERIFHFLKTRAEAQAGTLSLADLGVLRQQFLASLPKASNYFEGVDRQYNEASAAAAPECVSRETILATLVFACTHKAARTAFPQADHIGVNWLNQLCGGIARYIRKAICADANDRLNKAYFEVAGRLGAKLVVSDLLTDEGVQRVLRECFLPLIAKDAVERVAEPLCDAVNSHIAGRRGISTADPSKVTEAEMKKFLTFLPPQLTLAFSAQAAA
jgi:hypothetical protein